MWSPSTFQKSLIRIFGSHSKFCELSLSRQYTWAAMWMILLSTRRTELDVQHDDDKWSLSCLTKKSLKDFRVILGFCWLILIRASVKFFTEIFALRKFVLPQIWIVEFRKCSKQICRAVCDWQNYFVMIFVTLQFPLHRVFERGFLKRTMSWFLNVRNQKESPFHDFTHNPSISG